MGQYIRVEPTHLNAKPIFGAWRNRTNTELTCSSISSRCRVQWWTHGWLLCKVIRINASKSIHTWHPTPPWKDSNSFILINIFYYFFEKLWIVWYLCLNNSFQFFWKYVLAKRYVKIRVILFKNWKYVFKHMY